MRVKVRHIDFGVGVFLSVSFSMIRGCFMLYFSCVLCVLSKWCNLKVWFSGW